MQYNLEMAAVNWGNIIWIIPVIISTKWIHITQTLLKSLS